MPVWVIVHPMYRVLLADLRVLNFAVWVWLSYVGGNVFPRWFLWASKQRGMGEQGQGAGGNAKPRNVLAAKPNSLQLNTFFGNKERHDEK